ncbi:hypothetical protein ABZ612_20310 [Streptomyces avermitilis]|uniref:hypothetical protein n=1 Tax=Streptomyces avermitilis TaxID=33903 RepID=UPI0033D3598C
MSAVSSKLTERFDRVRELVDVAHIYAEDGAALSAMQNLVDAIAAIRSIIEPGPGQDRRPVPLERLVETVETVEGAQRTRKPEEIAAVPWVVEAIGLHAPDSAPWATWRPWPNSGTGPRWSTGSPATGRACAS